jgi:hypothetical protein
MLFYLNNLSCFTNKKKKEEESTGTEKKEENCKAGCGSFLLSSHSRDKARDLQLKASLGYVVRPCLNKMQ